MFKKRYLSIIALTVLLVIISLIVAIRIEQPKIYAACRSAMLSIESYEPWRYQRTSFFPPPIAVVFDDGTNTASCQVQRSGSEWHVIHIWKTLVGRLNGGEGKYGVIP